MTDDSTGRQAGSAWQGRFDRLFVGAFIAGAFAILALHRLYGPRLAAELVPVGLMVLYGSAQWWKESYQGHEDRLGDNVYYLGFLFTLTSLLVSLLTLNASNAKLSSILVYSFGIALTTTIVGLLGRIILYQLYGEPHEDPVVSLQSLGESARQASQELNRAVERIRYTTVEGTASTREFFAEVSVTARQAVEEIRRSYTETSLFIRESLAEAASAVRETFNDSAGSLKAAAADIAGELRQNLSALHKRIDAVGTRVDAVVGALEQMTERIGKVEVPADLITKRLNPFADGVAQALEEVAQAARTAGDSNDRLSASLSRIEGNVVRINNAMLKLAEITDQLGGLVLLFKQIREEMALLPAALKKACDTIIASAGDCASTMTRLVRQAGEDADFAARYRQSLEQELQRSRSMLETLANDLQAAGARLRERAEKDAELSAQYRAELERELEKARALRSHLHDNAVSLIRFISDNLANA